MTVERLSAVVYMTDEDIVDGLAMRPFLHAAMGIKSPPLTAVEEEMLRVASASLAVKERERIVRWKAMPLRRRLGIRVRLRWDRLTRRPSRAVGAFVEAWREA